MQTGILLQLGFDIDVPSLVSLIQISMAIAVYGLTVNLFYQVMSKRLMFQTKSERKADEEIAAAMEQAEVASEEAKELKEAAREGEKVDGAAVHEATEETKEAIQEVKAEVEKQRVLRRTGWRPIYFILFPLLSFAFFVLLSANLLMLSDQSPTFIFRLALAIILAVRITAYISEATSHDLAKMLPLGLLGFLLIRGGFTSIVDGLNDLWSLIDEWRAVATSLAMVILTEFTLRVILISVRKVRTAQFLKRSGR